MARLPFNPRDAQRISVGRRPTLLRGSLDSQDDTDLYRFRLTSALVDDPLTPTINEGASFSLSLILRGLSASSTLTLFNSSGQVRARSNFPGNDTSQVINIPVTQNEGLAPGNYFIQVRSNGGSTGYRLTAVSEPRFPEPLPIPRPLPARRLDTARSLDPSLSQTLRGNLNAGNAEDLYAIQVDRNSTLSALLRNLRSNADIALYDRRGRLLNSDGEAFDNLNDDGTLNPNARAAALSNNTGSASEVISGIPLVPGSLLTPNTYYVRVFRRSGNTPYRLTLTLQPSERPPNFRRDPQLVSDINPGIAPSNPATIEGGADENEAAVRRRFFARLGNLTYFAADNGVNGRELFVTDGTSDGTRLVSDLNPGEDGSDPSDFLVYRDALYFAATGPQGRELYRFQGGTIGLVRDLNTISSTDPEGGSTNDANPRELVISGDLFYFTADDGVRGRELYQSDGTEGNTRLVSDINPGPTGSDPTGLTAFRSNEINYVYFAANNGRNGNEFYRSDGTNLGTLLVRDINDGDGTAASTQGASSDPRFITVFRNQLYFGADDGETGRELWRSSGDIGDAAPVGGEIFPGGSAENPNSSDPQFLTAVGQTLYFSAENEARGRELWSIQPRSNTPSIVADLSPGTTSSSPANLVAVGQTVYFTATANSGPGTTGTAQIWRSRGTPQLTVQVSQGIEGLLPTGLTPIGPLLYFQAVGLTTGAEPFTLQIGPLPDRDRSRSRSRPFPPNWLFW